MLEYSPVGPNSSVDCQIDVISLFLFGGPQRRSQDFCLGGGAPGREIFFPEEFRPSHYLVW